MIDFSSIRDQYNEIAYRVYDSELYIAYKRLTFRMDHAARMNIYYDLRDRLAMQVPLGQALDEQWANASDDGATPYRPTAVAVATWRKALKERNAKLADVMGGWVPAHDLMLIRAGEATGKMSAVLEALTDMDGVTGRIKAAIWKACGYPLVLLAMFIGVIYSFGTGLFQVIRATSSAASLSPDIKDFMALADFLIAWGPLCLMVLGVIIVGGLISLPLVTGRVRSWIDRFPPFSFYKLWQEVYFLLALAALLKAMVGAKSALDRLLEGQLPYLRERLLEIWRNIRDGKGEIGTAMFLSPFNFPERDIARNIRSLEARGNIGVVVDQKTRAWIEQKTRQLERISGWILFGGIAINGAFVVYVYSVMTSFTDAVDSISR